ncbi:ferritin-like domain-containing protein [Streptomyces sp. H34-S4]|uniref:ferritin-like domain-containing protein n=1 Tax=Streptomyces sp. H34-S4 TaxID=2996463 RepID=UPI00226F88B9|nr:ferritin-like domain-containing protein [Streptomyces sp. H34-S4]MCY0934030.1 ferritin-like domain-containing protein [Streptomyces sp. H34-S4]
MSSGERSAPRAQSGSPSAARRSRFQVGEDGDGSALIGKADRAGDAAYARAVRLFVAEEQNHARMLALLLAAGGSRTLTGHWSDAAFVRLRRLLGLRVELLVLMVADEERHVPFHCVRLREALAPLPAPARRATTLAWQALLAGAAAVVAADHGPALRSLGLPRRTFVSETLRSSPAMAAAMRGTPVPRAPLPAAR